MESRRVFFVAQVFSVASSEKNGYVFPMFYVRESGIYVLQWSAEISPVVLAF